MPDLPSPSKRFSRKWLIVPAVLIVLAGGGWFGGSALLTRYLNSQNLREKVSAKTGQELDGQCGYLPFSWSGLSAHSGGLLVRTQPDRALRELRGKNLRAQCNLAQLWRGEIHIEQLTLDELEAAFSDETVRELRVVFNEPPKMEPPSTEDSVMKTELRQIDVARTRLFWGKEKSEGGFREVATTFHIDGDKVQVQGRGGTFRQAGWPEARVSDFRLFYAKPQLRVDEGTLHLGEQGTVAVKGLFQFDEDPKMDLQLEFANCPIAPFIEEDTRKKFSGEFASVLRLQKALGKKDTPAAATGDIRFANAIVRNVEGLEKLAIFTGRKEFARLTLEELHGQWRWEGERLLVEDFTLEARGLIRATGSFTVQEKVIDGTFELGATAAVLERFPGAREEVFTERRGDYFYATVKVTGPLGKPRHDLKKRLISAAKKHYAKKFLAPILKPGEEVIEALEKLF